MSAQPVSGFATTHRRIRDGDERYQYWDFDDEGDSCSICSNAQRIGLCISDFDNITVRHENGRHVEECGGVGWDERRPVGVFVLKRRSRIGDKVKEKEAVEAVEV